MRIRVAVICSVLAGCGPSPAPNTASKTETKAEAKPDLPVITMFYAAPPRPAKGENVNLCYGVQNADEVTLDPPVDRVWPSVSRCIEISPAKNATYTLTARRGNEKVSKSVTVTVGPPAPKLIDVSVSSVQVRPGEQVTVCFHAKNATAVTIRPGQWIPPHNAAVGCSKDSPRKDTTYVITARGPGGEDTQSIPVKVK